MLTSDLMAGRGTVAEIELLVRVKSEEVVIVPFEKNEGTRQAGILPHDGHQFPAERPSLPESVILRAFPFVSARREHVLLKITGLAARAAFGKRPI